MSEIDESIGLGINANVADLLQATGDGLTYFRLKMAPIVGLAIAATQENWGTTMFAAGTQLTDLCDGKLVRKAAEIRGYEIKTDGAEQDPRADRNLTHAMMGGLIVRFTKQGDKLNSNIIAANLGLSLIRNLNMSINRQMIHEYSLDPNELQANKTNKIKMWLQSVGLTALSSPAVKRPLARAAASAFLTAGTITGVIGERIFNAKVNRLIKEKQST